jgi:hypothetical protein
MTLRQLFRELAELNGTFSDMLLDMPMSWWTYGTVALLALVLLLWLREWIDQQREARRKGTFRYQWEHMRGEEIERARQQSQREIRRAERWARESAGRRKWTRPGLPR